MLSKLVAGSWRGRNRSATLRPIRLGWPVSGVWVLRDTPAGTFLIDTGFWTHRNQLVLGLRTHGVNPYDVKGIILTHRHLDHAGNAEFLRSKFGIPVYAHRADAPMLRGEEAAPKLQTPVGFVGALAVLENEAPARVRQVTELEEGEQVAGLEVLWMPGHTMGSIFLYHRETATLFSGDTLLNAIPPLVQTTALSLPFAGYCDDHELALRSLRRFLSLGLEVRQLCPGHGPVRRGNIVEELGTLLSSTSA